MPAGDNAAMTASSSIDSTVDLGFLGPVRRSAVDERLRHLATVLWLTHGARPRPSGFLHSAVSLDGLPRPLWRSREELAHTASFQHMVNNAPSKTWDQRARRRSVITRRTTVDSSVPRAR